MKRYKKRPTAPKQTLDASIGAPDASKSTIEGVLDASIDTLRIGIDAIRREIMAIATGTAKKTKHDAASRIAFLTGKVGSIADSIRKVEAARAKRFDDLTPAMVLAWLRQLGADERTGFLREASRIDARKSGLA